MPARIDAIMDTLDLLAPWALAEDWDNAGLQVGRAEEMVSRAVVALDAGEAEIAAAAAAGAQLLLTHHPMIFRPIKRIDLGSFQGSLVAAAVRSGLSVVSAHTNLDKAPGGLADSLAVALGLGQVRPLAPSPSAGEVKLTVFVPEGDAGKLMAALGAAGAGRIGLYEGCFFTATGKGYFTPLAGARPRLGVVGRAGEVRETRLETRVERRLLPAVLEALRSAHPYEEPAVDLYPVEGTGPAAGLGRVGETDLEPGAFAALVGRVLPGARLRSVGRPPARVRRAAVVPGSGGDHVIDAVRAGAQVLVTGEMRYHQALEARAAGLWVLEGGHGPTELPGVELMAAFLERESAGRGWGLEIVRYPVQGDIYHWM